MTHDAIRRPQSRFAAGTVEKNASPPIDPRFAAAHYEHDLYVGTRPGDGMAVASAAVITARVPITNVDDVPEHELSLLERLVWRNQQMRAFLLDLLDPEKYGHAVTAEVRDRARELLGMPRVETKR